MQKRGESKIIYFETQKSFFLFFFFEARPPPENTHVFLSINPHKNTFLYLN